MTPFSRVHLPEVHRAASPGCTRRAHTKPVVGNARSGYYLVTTSAVHALHCGVMVRPGSARPWRLRNFRRIGDLNHRRANRVTAPRKPRPSLSQGSEAGTQASPHSFAGCDRHAATSLIISRWSAPGTQALVHNGPGEGEIHGKWPTPCISSQAQAVQWAPGAIGAPAPSSQWWDRF